MNYVMKCKKVSVYYGAKKAIDEVDLNIEENTITSFIGPSGCGKSTFLRCLNRMNDTIPICKVTGKITLDDVDINSFDPVELRAMVGMIFQKPNPFPKSIFENVAYGPKIHGLCRNKKELAELVEHSLEKVGLLNEVKDRLNDPGTGLSGGQQQRLCIARAIAIKPKVLLMDEPCSALDPIATAKIEAMMNELKKDYTIIIVTHSMAQAERISDYTAFFYLGEIKEFNKTNKIFHKPKNKTTKDYIEGVMG